METNEEQEAAKEGVASHSPEHVTMLQMNLPEDSESNAFLLAYALSPVPPPLITVEPISVSTVVQGNVLLPCNIHPEKADDTFSLVLWYREPSGIPIYSFDCRVVDQINGGIHWSDEDVFGSRAYFRAKDPIGLQIDNAKESDEGIYRCRVDFLDSPTRNQRVMLSVIVPPEVPRIFVSQGDKLVEADLSFQEGDNVILVCETSGGRPAPSLKWYRENALLDDSYETFFDGTVRNKLQLAQLSRSDVNAKYSCHAANDVTVPLHASVTIDMIFAPLGVEIKTNTNEDFMLATKKYTISCKAWGSRPSAMITWLLEDAELTEVHELISVDENLTISTIELTPMAHHHRKRLVCEARNPEIRDSEIIQFLKLNIHFTPEVKLEFGTSLNPLDIKVGDDVYFECYTVANPWIYKVTWKHNDQNILENRNAGIIMSNLSLVLQKVSQNSAGFYSCVASNVEGDGESEALELTVKFAPTCGARQKFTYGVARKEEVQVTCTVDAVPPATSFQWTFNSSGEVLDIAHSWHTDDSSRSVLRYVPVTDADYGTLLCWASNEMGRQAVPCLYRIIPAGKPDALTNCSVTNMTESFIHIQCQKGFDGGLPQIFVLEMFSTGEDDAFVTNVTSDTPDFVLHDFLNTEDLQFVLYSRNSKGESEKTLLRANTFRVAQKRLGDPNFQVTPILAILMGTIVTLVLLAAIAVVTMTLRMSGKQKALTAAHPCGLSGKAVDGKLKETNPDIIPRDGRLDCCYATATGLGLQHHQKHHGLFLPEDREDFLQKETLLASWRRETAPQQLKERQISQGGAAKDVGDDESADPRRRRRRRRRVLDGCGDSRDARSSDRRSSDCDDGGGGGGTGECSDSSSSNRALLAAPDDQHESCV